MAVAYSVRILASARRQLLALPRPLRERVRLAIRELRDDPRPAGTRLLSGQGRERVWRLRVGEYRVLYEIQDGAAVVLVIRIAHRRNAYR